jgi:chemotaxis protein histidine kinase CheA
MFKFSYGVLTAATIAAAIGPAFAQQPATPPAQAAASDTGQSAAPAGAYAYIQNLKNGDTVTSPFKVQFGLSSNMGVGPAGVEKEKVGHHHLLIDTTLSDEEMTQPITMDEQHKHFGGGQTETIVTLPPGKHTLQLVLANWTHIPFKPPVQSEVITITVQDEAAAKAAADAAIKQAAETKQAEEAKAAKEAQEAKEALESKQAAEAKEATAAKEAKEAQEAKAAKEALEAKQATEAEETKQAKAAKETDESKKVMHRRHHRHHRHHYYHRRHLHREQMLHT